MLEVTRESLQQRYADLVDTELLRRLRADTLTDLFVKRAKCVFGAPSVAYLSHVISEAGVAMDLTKVQAIIDWPAPRSARAVR